MSLEHLISPQIIVPVAFFAMPVAMVWLKKHYAALEKGHIKAGGELSDGGEKKKRLALLEAQNRELLERVQNLESIVCALDEAPRPKALPQPEKMTVGR